MPRPTADFITPTTKDDMTTDLQIKRATRQGVKPLIGLFGKSGSGKTYSALLLARGIVGPTGRITIIDTEAGRGSLFADLIPGGYDTLEISEPFTPAKYSAAIDVAEKQSDCIVIDSMTHAWEGEGGVLDAQEAELDRMAGSDWKKREACKMAAWIKPKMEHKKFIGRLLRSRCALICCLRAQEKTHIEKDENGKNKVVTDKFSSPIFDHRFIFELLINGETLERDGVGGFVHWTKITHPHVRPCLPAQGEQIGIKHGEALAKWCANPGQSPQAAPSTQKPASKAAAPQPTEKTRAWMIEELLKQFDEQELLQFAIDKGHIMPTETLRDWKLDRVAASRSALVNLCADINEWKEGAPA